MELLIAMCNLNQFSISLCFTFTYEALSKLLTHYALQFPFLIDFPLLEAWTGGLTIKLRLKFSFRFLWRRVSRHHTMFAICQAMDEIIKYQRATRPPSPQLFLSPFLKSILKTRALKDISLLSTTPSTK